MLWDPFWRRRRFSLFPEFEQIEETIDQLIREAMEWARFPGVRASVEGPYVYGFSMSIGPDGKPQIREFGNVRPTSYGRAEISGVREPFTDVMEEEDKLRIILEIPGVEKEDVKVSVSDAELVVRAERGDRRYEKHVPLPGDVDTTKVKAKYNNGILELSLPRVRRAAKERHTVPVE
ncbi:MAG: Hsp20/alpha crystallin family protein [Methanobacteriota archaeon]|nr:MAG: Hsp20/alpha crystallin family protein [Euryarchaeota archaeon]